MSPTDSLRVSWPELISRIEPSGTFSRWRAAEPALARIASLDHLAAIVHHPSWAGRADELLGALLRLAAVDGGNDQDAALLVAHLLANGTRKLALQLADLAADIDDQIAATLWLKIRMFPWRRRTHAYAKNLLLDTRKTLVPELCPDRARRQTDAGTVTGLPAPVVIEEHDRDESGLRDVLDWAQRSGVIDAADVALLNDLVLAADGPADPSTCAWRSTGPITFAPSLITPGCTPARCAGTGTGRWPHSGRRVRRTWPTWHDHPTLAGDAHVDVPPQRHVPTETKSVARGCHSEPLPWAYR